MRFALFGFAVEALVRGGEDFGKITDGKFSDEGKGDTSPIFWRPLRKATNECFNHVIAFIQKSAPPRMPMSLMPFLVNFTTG